jgi:hypothetical protein
MVLQQLQNVATDRTELIAAFASSALAAIIIRYVASVQHPVFGHAVLALLAVMGFVAAYLLIAASDATPDAKAGIIVGNAVVAGSCFGVTSFLV